MIYDVLAYKKENGTIPRYQIQMDVGDRKSTRLNSSHEWISYAVL